MVLAESDSVTENFLESCRGITGRSFRYMKSLGTAPAVVGAAEDVGVGETLVVAASDLIGDAGAVSRFVNMAVADVRGGILDCVLAVDWIRLSDMRPVSVRVDSNNMLVSCIGKSIESEPLTYSGIRVMSGEFCRAYVEAAGGSSSDTEVMSKLADKFPARIGAVICADFMDVDCPDDWNLMLSRFCS
ncbi:hypothetical protein [Tsukamurella pseudospumae]|uniref:hypothetical protein n=1 Tax=Tsukamurella pseudospumae TaxID=239498 RepID=UPI003CC7DCBC